MYGLWLLILFGAIPASIGAALAYVISRQQNPGTKILAVGAGVGAAIGLIAGIMLARW